MTSSPDVSTRIALVTGGSRGVGRACVETLACRGYTVFAVGRDKAALDSVRQFADDSKWRVHTRVCDITDEQSVVELFSEIGNLRQYVDILVNNAGAGVSAPVRSTTREQMIDQFVGNVLGAYQCTRAALPHMIEVGWGRLVFIASTAGLVGSRYTSAYASAKHALVGFTRSVAAECVGTGITSNAVCPTYVRTDMTARSVERIVERTGITEENALGNLTGASSLGRLLEPVEVAEAVAYLVSEHAGAINGQALVLDGGTIQH
jgi:NAD(P)-dependent dehydrogenase (short-subunit alcohol dehydrogenase family)